MMGEYRLPETVVERGAAEVGRRERLSPTGDRAYGTAKAVLTAALNLTDDPVERVARALYEQPPVHPDAPAWEDLPEDGDSSELGCNTQAEYRDKAQVALQALGLHEPEGEEPA